MNDHFPDELDDDRSAEAIIMELSELAAATDSPSTQQEVQETTSLLTAASNRGLIQSGVRRLDLHDVAEAIIGSVIFASPLLVEDGLFAIADHVFQTTVLTIPLFLLTNILFVILMTYALVEWTGRDKTETHLLFGIFPTRVPMILIVSYIVAAVLMTVWGRVHWLQPLEAIARITVLWTVASIGAALGDILSHEETDMGPPLDQDEGISESQLDTGATDRHTDLSDSELLRTLHEQFDEMEASVPTRSTRQEVERLQERTHESAVQRELGGQIRKYTSRDIAEAFVGSVFFSIPLLVEDGVFDVAEYFLSFRIGQFPVFFILNATFVLLMVMTLVYWTGPGDVQITRPIFGIIPRRLLGIAVVSFLTAAALMTMWGRVDSWQEPVIAVARISAVWTVASFGAALGDILPGESSGDDIYDDIADLGDDLISLDD